MWVTQTYLGNPDPKARIFTYYVYEEYSPDQESFTREVQRGLEQLGRTYREKASLLMPNPQYTAEIGGELRDIEQLWWAMAGKLPGILVTRRPLSEFDPHEEFYLISFDKLSPNGAAEVIEKVNRTLNEQLSHIFANPSIEKKGWWKTFYDALELKPGYGGVRIDLKKLPPFADSSVIGSPVALPKTRKRHAASVRYPRGAAV
jgi:hypothetical protein